MPLPNPIATVDDPVTLAWLQGVQNHVQNTVGAQLFTANGTFTVPEGVHNITVYLCGGGGRTVNGSPVNGLDKCAGGYSPMAVKHIAVEPGQSFGVVIGAAGTSSNGGGGKTSQFGTVLYSSGGAQGAQSATAPANGVATGQDYIVDNFIRHADGRRYGVAAYGRLLPRLGLGGEFGSDPTLIFSPEQTVSGAGVCLVCW